MSQTKVILITGTSSGFGWLIAKTCAALGHSVYAGMRNTKGANANKAKELSMVKNIHVLDMDVTDEKEIKASVNTILKNDGRIDVVINNAGIYAIGLAETFVPEDLEKFIGVNAVAPWKVIRAVLPNMRKQRSGLIINVSSVAGRFSFPFQMIYNSSKFALEGLTEGLHFELKGMGIDIVLLQPGPFPTEIFGKTFTGSNAAITNEYGDLANIPQQMGAGLEQLFKTTKPNPQLVADAVVNLINTPSGKRSLRTVVDPSAGALTETANEQVMEQYRNFLTAFGMQAMLN